MNLAGIATVAIPAALISEFETWEEGFDAATNFEQSGGAVICPYVGKQGALWQQGFNASRKVTEIGQSLSTL